MTTAVIVKAHCAKNKEVVIKTDDNGVCSSTTIQDGETHEAHAYENRVISVYEKMKEGD